MRVRISLTFDIERKQPEPEAQPEPTSGGSEIERAYESRYIGFTREDDGTYVP
jgi:hypothetical protein